MKTGKDQMIHADRLLERADFLRVQGAGRKWITPNLIIQLADQIAVPGQNDAQKPACRVGLTVTKKIFPLAVDRNRMKRRLRALMFAILAENPLPGQDMVVLPRKPALDATPETLEKDMKWAIKRLLSPQNPSDKAKTGDNGGKIG